MQRLTSINQRFPSLYLVSYWEADGSFYGKSVNVDEIKINNYKLVEETSVISLTTVDSNSHTYIDISAPFVTNEKPIFVINGDFEANNFIVKGCCVGNPNTSSSFIRVYYSNSAGGNARINYRYWTTQ